MRQIAIRLDLVIPMSGFSRKEESRRGDLGARCCRAENAPIKMGG